ncbi:MAG: glycosyltransferase family 2 protein [Bacilli bacterium]
MTAKLSVIIPIFNTGRSLLERCWPSLQSSTVYSDLEILLIDDGSTCSFTRNAIHFLEKTYPNVHAYTLPLGGSGSPSRPRNFGMQIASAPFLTFLDSDNSVYASAYEQLLNAIDQYEWVGGNVVRLGETMTYHHYYDIVENAGQHNGLIFDGVTLLVGSKFSALSIQAIVFSKSFLQHCPVRMVEGALGEDTLFFWQMLLYTSNAKILNVPIHLYDASREGSLVNTVDRTFFERYLTLEHAKITFLSKHNLLDAYVKRRWHTYWNDWYLKKLALVSDPVEYNACVTILEEIANNYNDYFPHLALPLPLKI